MFSKEPEILFKAEPPKELYVGAPSAKSSGKNGGASLRRKNSPHKDVIANNGQA